MHNRNLRYFLYKIKLRLKRRTKTYLVKIKREIPQCDSSFMTTSKKFSESGKLMSITLEPLHRFVCGFRRLKVRFIINSNIPIWNVNNVGNESKNTENKTVLQRNLAHQIGLHPGHLSSSRRVRPGRDYFSSSQLSAKTGQYK